MDSDKVFAGAVPQLYERYMVPMIFEPYAADLVARLRARPPARILEIAAGTGAVTRAMVSALPEASVVATDLNPGMLEEARSRGTARPIEWRQADASALPFPDASFDAVVCQFGTMFFPDKPKAFAEVRRVLAAGGRFLFNVWGAIETSEFAHTVLQALERVFPDDPPRFITRTPHGYFQAAAIARDLATAGFTTSPSIETVTAQSRAASPGDVALAFCQGTPIRGEIEARDAARLGEATAVAARLLTERFGAGPVEGGMEAVVVSVER
jgi:SAM-dependent methyltransferase